jgi:hypothetical protein
VDWLLTGTVRWEKGAGRSRVRVSPELVEARTGITRWSQTFDAGFTDVFTVQANIAGQVATALHVALTDSARRQLATAPTSSLDAYAHFLRSRELRAGEISPDVLRAAIGELEQAVKLDPRFVVAWADLAQLQMEAFRLGGMRVSDANTAEATLRHALTLAPSSPDVRAASGRYKLMVEGDAAGSRAEYREAQRAVPNRSDLLSGAGTAELDLGRWSEAVTDLQQALGSIPALPIWPPPWRKPCSDSGGIPRRGPRSSRLAGSGLPVSASPISRPGSPPRRAISPASGECCWGWSRWPDRVRW